MSWPSPRDLLPHQGPACVLDAVLSHDPTQTTCLATPRRGEGLDDGDGVSVLLTIELIAQAAAVHAALRNRGPQPRGGLLVAVQQAVFHLAALPCAPLRVQVHQTHGGDGALAAFTGAVHLDQTPADQTPVATAELRVARD